MKFKITNLDCVACIKLSTMALKKLPGVTDVKIDLKSGKAELSAEHEIVWEQVVEALRSVDKQAINS